MRASNWSPNWNDEGIAKEGPHDSSCLERNVTTQARVERQKRGPMHGRNGSSCVICCDSPMVVCVILER